MTIFRMTSQFTFRFAPTPEPAIDDDTVCVVEIVFAMAVPTRKAGRKLNTAEKMMAVLGFSPSACWMERCCGEVARNFSCIYQLLNCVVISHFLSFLTITSTLTEISEFLGPPHGGKSEIGWNRLAGLGRRLGVERKLYPDSEYGDGA